MNPSRILIVEDELIVTMELEERLAAMGYQVVGTAVRGEDALRIAGLHRPELVLMDIQLRGDMDGIEAAREILTRYRIPVIFVTAYSEDSTLERAKLAEPYGYILKPFDHRELKSSIEIALYKHAAQEEIRRLNRLYDVLSQVNQAIVRIQTREELFPTVCRLVVERGEIDLAWVGWLDETGSRISAIAHFGKGGDMLSGLTMPGDGPGVHNPLLSIRNGQPRICSQCGSDSCDYPGEKSPAAFGFQSCGSFPLRFQGKVCGALTLCASEPDFFKDREIQLLEEVALDISFALDKLEGDARRMRAERALRASESRYRKLFEDAIEGIVLADAETGEILDCNQAFERICGHDREALIGKPKGVLHAPGMGVGGSPVSLVLHQWEGEEKVLPVEILSASGEVKPVEVKASRLEIDGRRVLQGFFRDVTEEVRYHREQETTLRLLRLLNDPTDIREMIRNVTEFLREWSGCEAVGVRLREGKDFPYYETRGFSPQFVLAETWLCARDDFGQPILDGCGNPVLDCMCGNILSGRFDPALPFFTSRGSFWTNSTTDLLASTSEAERQARTRNRCHGEGYESVALIPMRYGQETLGLLQMNDPSRNRFTPELISFLEKTADQIAMALSQRQTLAMLQASEQRFRDVLEATGEYIWESDLAGCFSYVSDRIEAILEYTAEEVLGRLRFDFMEESDAERIRLLFERSTQEKAGFRDMEYRAVAKSGRRVWLSMTAVPVLDPMGRLIGYRGAVRDITERKGVEEEKKRLESQLRHAQKLEAIGTLAGGIAHDFNNILTPIIGYTEMALGDAPESSPLQHDLTRVLGAANRAKDLVKQILTFSRHKQEQLMRPTEISLVIKEALKLLRASLPSSIEIRQNLHKGIAMADATQIHQIVMNLCTNASHAMSDRGILDVSFREVSLSAEDVTAISHASLPPGAYLKLSVADTGHGMSAETLEHIFDPYFTTKAVGEGTGLGLAVVHGIVKSHGGVIRAGSTLGEGSVFEVYIPAVSVQVRKEADRAEPLPRGVERVLLVDDESMIVELTRRMLEILGYRVTARTDPREALALFRSNPSDFDLVITDYTMPHLTGIDLAGEILRVRSEMPVVLCTGFNERVTPEMVKAAGILDVLIKPFERGRLAELIREALDGKRG